MIELLIVIGIISIIASLVVVSLSNVRAKSRDAKRISDIGQVQKALEMYRNDNDSYPSAITSGEALVGPNGQTYMSKIPSAPGSPDGSCVSDAYTYATTDVNTTYSIAYCLGGAVQEITTGGTYTAIPGNIAVASGGAVEEEPAPEQTFVTCGDNYLYSGESYPTVLIGNQCWFGKNLNVGTRVDVTVTQSDNATIEKYCFNNSSSDCDTYGGFYQFDEVIQYIAANPPANNLVQGVCPTGWHIPRDADIAITLSNTLSTNIGGKLKEIGTTHWLEPNGDATNIYNFSLLGAGSTYPSDFDERGYVGYFWTTYTDVGEGTARAYMVPNYDGSLNAVNLVRAEENYGFPVRCLSDTTYGGGGEE